MDQGWVGSSVHEKKEEGTSVEIGTDERVGQNIVKSDVTSYS